MGKRRSFRDVFPFSSNVSDKNVWKKSSPNDITNEPKPNFPQTITKLFLFLDKFTCFLKKRLLQYRRGRWFAAVVLLYFLWFAENSVDKINFKDLIGIIGSIATVATVIVLACMGKTEGVVVTIVIGAIVFPLLLWYWLEKKIDGKIRSLIAETDFSQLNADVAELNKTKSEFDQWLNDCVASSKTATDKTDDFDNKLFELNNKVDNYSKKNAKLEVKVQKLEEALEKLNTAIRSAEGFKSWDFAEKGDRQVLTINEVEFAFRYCPPGDFMMGSPKDEEGRFDNENYPNVKISEEFWICEVPTTQEQWDAVGLKKKRECCFKGAKLPVENVTWNESDAFIRKLNELGISPDGWRFSLPTEEQWEYACRAGTTGSTYGVPLDEAAWHSSNSGSKTHEVGTKKPNKLGLYDMLGNVWEWTCSKYIDKSSFVSRGGGWCDSERYCRPANRKIDDPTIFADHLGFRCALVRQLSK